MIYQKKEHLFKKAFLPWWLAKLANIEDSSMVIEQALIRPEVIVTSLFLNATLPWVSLFVCKWKDPDYIELINA